MEEKKTKIIAVAGKGGVGKTSIAAVAVKVLTKRYPDKRILAIDADPAVGLATALGVTPNMTIDDIRAEITSAVDEGSTATAVELLENSRYRLFDAMTETDTFAFMAVGRPESAGCYCTVNSYLREVISMLSSEFDYVVIDGEAGIEQINRRVMEKVTHLLLVTDASKKGTQVLGTIKKVADTLVMYDELGAILNRLPDESVVEHMDMQGIPVLAQIPADPELAMYDIQGRSLMELPEDSIIVNGVEAALKKLCVI